MENEIFIFPDYFSENAVKVILSEGKKDNLHIFRVGKYGRDKTTAFLNYYEEILSGLKTVRNPQKYLEKCKNNIDQLSVSCYYDINDLQYYFEVTLKDNYPERVLLEGMSNSQYGLIQKTAERKKDVKNSHVDWWLFKGATPWLDFNEVKVE